MATAEAALQSNFSISNQLREGGGGLNAINSLQELMKAAVDLSDTNSSFQTQPNSHHLRHNSILPIKIQAATADSSTSNHSEKENIRYRNKVR